MNKSQLSTRWWILLLLSIVIMAQYYTYDNPSALHVQLEDYFTTIDEVSMSKDDSVPYGVGSGKSFTMILPCI